MLTKTELRLYLVEKEETDSFHRYLDFYIGLEPRGKLDETLTLREEDITELSKLEKEELQKQLFGRFGNNRLKPRKEFPARKNYLIDDAVLNKIYGKIEFTADNGMF